MKIPHADVARFGRLSQVAKVALKILLTPMQVKSMSFLNRIGENCSCKDVYLP